MLIMLEILVKCSGDHFGSAIVRIYNKKSPRVHGSHIVCSSVSVSMEIGSLCVVGRGCCVGIPRGMKASCADWERNCSARNTWRSIDIFTSTMLNPIASNSNHPLHHGDEVCFSGQKYCVLHGMHILVHSLRIDSVSAMSNNLRLSRPCCHQVVLSESLSCGDGHR